MARYEGTKFVLISPDELKLPDYVKEEFLNGKDFVEVASLEEAIGSLDILYMTRIQQERFADKAEYERLKDVYILDAAKLQAAKSDLSIMHPLPRVNEINTDVDEDPRADYFIQAANGRYIRMALILKLLADTDKTEKLSLGKESAALICHNPHCISKERGVRRLFVNNKCLYCDTQAEKV